MLLEFVNDPSIPYDTLVVELKISRRTVSRAFESLVEKGISKELKQSKKDIGK